MPMLTHISNGTDDDPSRCYICLCNKGERAPYCSRRESDDFIRPCKCSLVAHRKCFLSWVSSLAIPKVIGRDDSENNRFGIPMPFTSTPNPSASAYHCSIFRLFTGTLSPAYDKMCVFVDCPQCRRQICLATKNSLILNFRRFCEQIVDNVGSAALVSGVITTACVSLMASALFSLGVAGQDILEVMAKPSVQLGLYGTKHFPSISISDALDKSLISPQRFVSVTCFVPLYTMYMNSALPFGIQTDMMLIMLSYSLFNDPDGLVDTIPCRILRRLAFMKVGFKALYNITLNRAYYRWHKTIQPCFFADKMSAADLQRIEAEIEQDTERENQEEAAEIKDATYPFALRMFRKTGRFLSSMAHDWWREMILCYTVDFSRMFGSSSLYRRVLSTFLLPRVGVFVSTNLLVLVPGINGFLSKFSDTPDESLFLRNILGCVTVAFGRELLSFSLNYFRYRQFQSIDVDADPSDYWKYMADVYQDGNSTASTADDNAANV
ncbi:hypothetical protein FOA43_003698 [Brettanomyces nanus]|uniref:RING-CH-type domain-containing protein n=1 Tax=Eeniella nana TaxID=13502 RepID=A0A875S8V9_EENNA|nr:uncharacterized protein FOA43_003698 [Brettanomyces nanus]QPG76312.1 hypothetical protein FOA43_003698 [Brettanomyces nanus]